MPPMNILLITSDQQHYNAIGKKDPKLKTPNLDRLCDSGTTYNRAYCNNPLCSPSRSTMITGMYPSWHGCWTLGTKLAEDVPTVGEVLSRHGYQTSLIGKAHFQPLACSDEQTSLERQPVLRDLNFWRSFHGPWYGFDHVEVARMHADEAHAGQHYAIWMEEKGLKNWRDYFQEWPPSPETIAKQKAGIPYWEIGRQHKWDLPQEFHYTTWTAERSIAAIERAVHDHKPFFTWASFHDPHPPYLVPEPWASMYNWRDMDPGTLTPGEMDRMPPLHRLTLEDKPDFSPWQETPFSNHGLQSHRHDRDRLKKDMAIYYGMISFMDLQIGRILDRLDALGQTENTLVVFTTDHGHFLGHHGLIAKGPFHYEHLIRVPFVVRYPGEKNPGSQSDALQALIDLPETFLTAAGIPIPGIMQGVDQSGVWRGDVEQMRDGVIVENRHQPTALHLKTYVDNRYKLTIYRDREYGELFDLKNDPEEVHNLWNEPQNAALKGRLMEQALQAELRREPTRFPRISHA